MQVHVAGVLDRAVVQVAFQVLTHALGIEQGDLAAQATAHGLLVGCFQLGHVHRLHRRVQVAVLEVALDAVLGNAALDDLVTAPAQVPDEILDLAAEGLAHLLVHGPFAGQAAGDLAAIAAGGAPADLVGFDHRHLEAALGQLHRRGHAGETATDNGHIDLHRALHRRVIGLMVERGGVVGLAALGRRRHGLDRGVHEVSLLWVAAPQRCSKTVRLSGNDELEQPMSQRARSEMGQRYEGQPSGGRA